MANQDPLWIQVAKDIAATNRIENTAIRCVRMVLLSIVSKYSWQDLYSSPISSLVFSTNGLFLYYLVIFTIDECIVIND